MSDESNEAEDPVAMTKLEEEIVRLRAQLDGLAERVRLDAVAQAFLQGARGADAVRDGNYAVIDGFPTRVSIASDGIGKWSYFDGRNYTEPFRVPPSDDVQRLYTAAEVAEILAKEGADRRKLAELAEQHVEFLSKTQLDMSKLTIQTLSNVIQRLREENEVLRRTQAELQKMDVADLRKMDADLRKMDADLQKMDADLALEHGS